MKITQKLEQLLEKHAALSTELERHKKLAVTLEQEEKELMDHTDLDDATQYEKISALRLRRELTPRKIASFEGELENIKYEIKEEAGNVNSALWQIIKEKKNALFSELYQALHPFFAGRTHELRAAVAGVISETNFSSQTIHTEIRLAHQLILNRPKFFGERELIALAPVIDALKIYCEPGAQSVTLKTTDQIEREELQALQKDPTEAIEWKIKCKLSKEKAEKAVQARIKFLQGKFQEKPPITTNDEQEAQ